MSEYILVDNPQKLDIMVNSIMSSLAPLELDSETTALHPKDGKLRLIQLNRGTGIFLVDCFAFDNYKQLYKIKQILEDRSIKKILHNVKFDWMWFYAFLDARMRTFFDTFVADVLIDYTAGHKLSDIARRYLNVDLDKTEQKSDWSGVLTQEQLKYAAKDVVHLSPIREIQIKKLQETSQLAAAKIEYDAVPVISEMEYRGFAVSQQKYQAFAENNKKIRDEKEKALLTFLQTRGGKKELPKQIFQEDIFGELLHVKTSNDINVASWQQVLPIYQEMGIPITSTDQKVIKPLLPEYPELSYLIEHREWAKLCSAFGDSLVEKIENGRIYSEMRQLGTVTARLSNANPNLQQLPNSKECRSCFTAPEGRKLVISDYSTFELRILAEIANDPVMIAAFNEGKDLHSMTASTVFGIPYEEIEKGKKDKYKDKRYAAKTGNFAICYGINASALMNRIKAQGVECDEDVAQKIIDGFYTTYQGAGKWLFAQEKKILRNPIITGIGGHRIHVPFIKGDRSSERGAGRDARNYPIQNANAVATKRAMPLITNKFIERGYSHDTYLTLSIHDELIAECPEHRAEEVKEIVQWGMESAAQEYLKKVKISAEAAVCSSWAEKG